MRDPRIATSRRLVCVVLLGLSLPAAEAWAGWVARYDGGGRDVGRAVVPVTGGAVISVGSSGGVGGTFDVVVLRYSAIGVLDWVQRYDGPAAYEDRAIGAVPDGAGGVYVAATSDGSAGCRELTLLKYSGTGQFEWAARTPGPDSVGAEASDLARDPSGSVIVGGYAQDGVYGTYDGLVMKCSSAGAFAWSARFAGPDSSSDVVRGVAVDSTGNVVAAGCTIRQLGVSEWFVVKYSTTGALQWQRTYSGPGGRENSPTDVAVDGAGNIVVVGYGARPTSADLTVVKWSPAGDLLWERHYDGPGQQWDGAACVVVGGGGDIFVTGAAMSPDTTYRRVTLKYSAPGDLLWAQLPDGTGSRWDEGIAIAVGSDGAAYSAGIRADSSLNASTIRYASNGQPTSAWVYDGPDHDVDAAMAVALGSGDRVFVTGGSVGVNLSEDMITMAWDSANVVTRDPDISPPMRLSFGQAEPNPAAGTARVVLVLPGRAVLTARLYDLQGRERLMIWRRRDLPAGKHELVVPFGHLPAGVYFCRLEGEVRGEHVSINRRIVRLP